MLKYTVARRALIPASKKSDLSYLLSLILSFNKVQKTLLLLIKAFYIKKKRAALSMELYGRFTSLLLLLQLLICFFIKTTNFQGEVPDSGRLSHAKTPLSPPPNSISFWPGTSFAKPPTMLQNMQ